MQNPVYALQNAEDKEHIDPFVQGNTAAPITAAGSVSSQGQA